MSTKLIRLSHWLCVSFLLVGCAAQGAGLPPMPMTPASSLSSRPVPPAAQYSTPSSQEVTQSTQSKEPIQSPQTLQATRPPATPMPTATTPVMNLNGPLTVALDPGLPEEWAQPLTSALNQIKQVQAANGLQPVQLLDQVDNAQVVVGAGAWGSSEVALAQRFFAVVEPFATVRDDITFKELQQRWQGGGDGPLLASSATVDLLKPVLGQTNAVTVEAGDLLKALQDNPNALGLLPFDQIDPSFKVLTIDGVDVLSNHFDPAAYPLVSMLDLQGKAGGLLLPLLSDVITPTTNRNANALTTLIMTGVTAMSRGTAAAIDRNYPAYPAAIISATLAAADITHVSNEVPFLPDDECVTNNTEGNLTLCSKESYWGALEAIGTDIVGLSGNHVNDFGYDGARTSITWYRDHHIPIYGSGMNVKEACAPLLWKHYGNTFAFVAVLAFDPQSAWATDELPGACYYYDHKDEVLAEVRELAKQVDIVSVEFQYLEIYDPAPTDQQVREFREMRDAGAELVTGVQSHVPQAWETYGDHDSGGPGTISYGLGNLFFDQMWSWDTRAEQIARHTIYEGRVLNTEILTAVLEDYAQPRWATPDERAKILNRVFNAAPQRP